jgi:hypothetical protein
MPIPLTCPCGRALRIKDELAGRKVRCPACKDVLSVPEPGEDEDEEIPEVLPAETEEDDEAPPARPTRRDAVRPSRRRPNDDEDAETGIQAEPRRGAPPALPRCPDDEDEEPRRPRRRRRPRRAPRPAFGQGGFGTSEAGIAGGAVMMLIAVVWFFGGLAVGIIFIYPPILFILGIAAMVRGFTSR